jgi:integrase
MSLRALLQRFRESRVGKASKTRACDKTMEARISSTWKGGLDQRVSEIVVSKLEVWLAELSAEVGARTYNGYCNYLSQLFRMAARDGVIAESPMDAITGRKKLHRIKPNIPTETEFSAIVENARRQRFNAGAEESADFLEFLGRAGIGQAEALALRWTDVDWTANELRVIRKKTGAPFRVPIYADLRPLLEKLHAAAVAAKCTTGPLFKIADPRKALTAACRRLGFPKFTPRNLRQMKILALIKAGVNVKQVARWQGHQDGGTLILKRYSEVVSSGDRDYEQAELDKYNRQVVAAISSPHGHEAT